MSAQVDIELRLTLSRAPTNEAEADAIAEHLEKWLNGTSVLSSSSTRAMIMVRDAEVTDWTDVETA